MREFNKLQLFMPQLESVSRVASRVDIECLVVVRKRPGIHVS